jgi:hypothetical protein
VRFGGGKGGVSTSTMSVRESAASKGVGCESALRSRLCGVPALFGYVEACDLVISTIVEISTV